MPKATPSRVGSPTSTEPHSHPSAADIYADPVIYDILHAAGTAEEVSALEATAKRFAPKATAPGATWLEPACGTARHLRLLRKRGKRVVGFDAEPAMIRYAKQTLERSVFEARLDDFLDIRPRLRAQLAFNLINTIRHVQSDAEMLRHFDMIARALRPGGAYIVGLSLSLYGFESPTEDVWTGSRGTTKVTQVVQYLPPDGDGSTRQGREERVISHLTTRSGNRTRHLDSTYVLRTYSLNQWHRLIARSPLHIAGLVDQDGIEMQESPLGYAVYILTPRKKQRS